MADDTRQNTQAFLDAVSGVQSALAQRNGRASVLTPNQTLNTAFGPPAAGGFSSGTPVTPEPGNAVRLIDFPANINTNLTPRSNEAFGFPVLRAFSNVELVRLAIETRKDQIETLDWSVKIKDPLKGEKGENPDCRTIERFLDRPDGVNDFATWSRMLLEEMLVIDAPAIERVRNRKGQLAGLVIVPGDTIHPLLDSTGRRPMGPKIPAYQQIIKGKPWVNLTNDDMLYIPRNPRPGKIYGYSPVEQTIVTIQTLMKRQTGQLAYFTEGNIPAGILTGPEGWTVSQLAEMQNAFNEQLKNVASRPSTLIWTPFGTRYQEFKEAPLKQEFDEWLARIIQYAFNLPPTPFIRAMNRSTANNDSDRGKEEGLLPIKLWLKRILDRVIADDMGHPELEFVWTDVAEVDLEKQAKVDDLYLRNGSVTINEVRDRRGLQPVEGGDDLLVYSPTGVTPLDVLLEMAELGISQNGVNGANAPQPNAKNPEDANPNGTKMPKGKGPPDGHKPGSVKRGIPQITEEAPANKLAKATQRKVTVSMTRAKARRGEAALRETSLKALRKTGDSAAAQIERKLRAIHKAEATDPITSADDKDSIRKKAEAITAALSLFDFTALKVSFQLTLYELYLDGAVTGYAGSGLEVTEDVQKQLEAEAKTYAEDRVAEVFSPTSDTGIVSSTTDQLTTEVAKGLGEGKTASQIADAVQASAIFSEDRADRIASHEASMANAAGAATAFIAVSSQGVSVLKYWETMDDEKVEPICAENEDAGPIPLDKAFPSGDMNVPAHNNCRCSVGAVFGEIAAA